MFNEKSILIIGGDNRYLEIIDQLSDKKANVYVIGFDKIQFEQKSIKHITSSSAHLKNIDAIILPVSGVNDSGVVAAAYTDESIKLTEQLVQNTPDHCHIYTGILTPYLEQLCEKTNRQLIPIFNRDDLAILNSIPTAEGTLQIAMEETDYTIHSANVLVLGFGRIGQTIARLFSNVGANVTVAVRKAADKARIVEMGLKPINIKDVRENVEHANIVINTIQFPVLTSTIIDEMNKNTLIIDLASVPGGTDFNSAEENEIKAIHALGLPGKVAPKTAGKVMSDVLSELISGID